MLELYRSALALRRQLPELGAETDATALVWLPAPDGVLAFRRGDGFVCTVNTGSEPVSVPVPGALLLASTDVPVGAGRAELPADSAAWWRV
jgi:alpha-glucosidase